MLRILYIATLAIAVAWSSWACFGPGGLILCAIIFSLALFLAGRWITFALFIVVGLMLTGLLLPAVNAVRESSRYGQCTNNLRMLALSLLDYQDAHRSLPQQPVSEKDGTPLLSWRVLVLPYIEYEDLCRAFDMSQAWDGPENRKLLLKRPRMLCCPSDSDAWEANSATTNYLAVKGTGTFWQQYGGASTDTHEWQELAARSVLLIETANSGIQWTEPRDLCIDNLEAATDVPSASVVQSVHTHWNGYLFKPSHGVNVTLADGRVSFLPLDNMSPQKLAYLLTAGDWKEQPPNIDWPACGAFAFLVASSALLLHAARRSRRARLAAAAPNA